MAEVHIRAGCGIDVLSVTFHAERDRIQWKWCEVVILLIYACAVTQRPDTTSCVLSQGNLDSLGAGRTWLTDELHLGATDAHCVEQQVTLVEGDCLRVTPLAIDELAGVKQLVRLQAYKCSSNVYQRPARSRVCRGAGEQKSADANHPEPRYSRRSLDQCLRQAACQQGIDVSQQGLSTSPSRLEFTKVSLLKMRPPPHDERTHRRRPRRCMF